MRIVTTTANRWLRLKRHLRSCTATGRVGRPIDHAGRGERASRRRGLCGRTGFGDRADLAR